MAREEDHDENDSQKQLGKMQNFYFKISSHYPDRSSFRGFVWRAPGRFCRKLPQHSCSNFWLMNYTFLLEMVPCCLRIPKKNSRGWNLKVHDE